MANSPKDKVLMKIFFILLMCFNVIAETNEKSVTIPLKEYEELRRQLEIQNVMVIEKLTLEGSFKSEQFAMKLNGRMIGKSKKEGRDLLISPFIIF